MVEAKPNGATAIRRKLSIRAPDRPGLIRDVSLSLVADKVDVETVVAHTAVRSDGLVDAVRGHRVRGPTQAVATTARTRRWGVGPRMRFGTGWCRERREPPSWGWEAPATRSEG